MPKKLLGLIGLFIIATGLLVSLNLAGKKQDIRKKASSSGSVLTIEPVALTVNNGETFHVLVNVDTGDDTISAAKLSLTYDPAVLSGVSITPGTFLPTEVVKGFIGQRMGLITVGSEIVLVNPPDTYEARPKKGVGTLATLTFTALKAAATQIEFNTSGTGTEIVAIDKNGNTLAKSTGGTVTVLDISLTPTVTPDPNATSTPTPSVTPIPTITFTPTATPTPLPNLTITPTVTPILTGSPTPTPTSIQNPSITTTPGNCIRKVHGDANCDGKVDGIDYSFWLNSQCHLTSGQICADKSADFSSPPDGNIDDDDYAIWFQYRDN